MTGFGGRVGKASQSDARYKFAENERDVESTMVIVI
jgi:hypothetical protein